MKKLKIIFLIVIAIVGIAAVAVLGAATNKLYTKVSAMEKKDKKMTAAMKKSGFKWDTFFLNYANGAIHEIYDNSKVVEAYKSGDASKLDEQDKFVLDTAAGIIKDVIKDGMTEYEKELAIYDWQFSYIHFDEGSLAAIPEGADLNYTPYGVLKSHSAICVGNATTFQLFMDLLGIDSKIIHSTTQGEHAWNLVKIDGDWYHVDVTFDGGSEKGKANYSCFNVPDSVKQNGSYPYNTDDFPKATSYKHWLNYQNGMKVEDYYKIPQLLSEAVKEEKAVLVLRYADPRTKNQKPEDDKTKTDKKTGNSKDVKGKEQEYIYTEVAQMIEAISSQYLSEKYYIGVTEQKVGEEIMAVISIQSYITEPENQGPPVIDMDKALKEAAKYFKEK